MERYASSAMAAWMFANKLLKAVHVSQLNLDVGDGSLRRAVDNFFGVDTAEMTQDELYLMGSAMLKDEDLCIRCGLCAEKCPTQRVTMDAMNYSFRWIDSMLIDLFLTLAAGCAALLVFCITGAKVSLMMRKTSNTRCSATTKRILNRETRETGFFKKTV